MSTSGPNPRRQLDVESAEVETDEDADRVNNGSSHGDDSDIGSNSDDSDTDSNSDDSDTDSNSDSSGPPPLIHRVDLYDSSSSDDDDDSSSDDNDDDMPPGMIPRVNDGSNFDGASLVTNEESSSLGHLGEGLDYENDDGSSGFQGNTVRENDDEEDDDQQDDNSQTEHEMPQEMYQFFRMIAQMENPHIFNWDGDVDIEGYSDNDDDDDYSDNSDDDDDDDDDTFVNGERCNCSDCLMKRIVGCKNCFDEDSVGENDESCPISSGNNNKDLLDPEASPCAICLEPETAKRPFVHLPCCQPTSTTKDIPSNDSSRTIPIDTSSMRFCQKCLAKYFFKSGCAVPINSLCENAEAQMMGECPRCKKLLVLKECTTTKELWEKRESLSSSQPQGVRLPIHKRTRAAIPSTEALFWYIARPNKSSDMSTAEYRAYLLTLAVSPNPQFIPEELLLNNSSSPNMIQNLCQWGLLHRRNTTQEWLPTLGTALANLYFVFYSFVEELAKNEKLWQHFWRGIVALGFGQKLESLWSNKSEWIISKFLRSVSVVIQKHPNHAGNVYYIEPKVQSELRNLVLKNLAYSVNGEVWDHAHSLCEHDDYDSDNDIALQLLPPLMRPPTDEELEVIMVFCEKNSRRQSLLLAYNYLYSAWMAICRFRLLRSLRLVNHGLSLALLSIKHLGLPPVHHWPTYEDLNSNISTSNTSIVSRVVTSVKNIRWRWHLMSGFNAILMGVALKIILQLIFIGMYLLLGFAICLLVGELLEMVSIRKPCGETDQWFHTKRLFGKVFILLYLAWNYSFHYTWLLLGSGLTIIAASMTDDQQGKQVGEEERLDVD